MKKKITSHLIAVLLCLLPIVGIAQQNDPQPDLIVNNLQFTYNEEADNPLSYTYQITNIGDASTNVDGINIQIALAEDPLFAGKGAFIDTIAINEPIAPGEVIPLFGGTDFFDSKAGLPYLVVRVDGQNILEESDESNNSEWVKLVPPYLTPDKDEVNNQLIVQYTGLNALQRDSVENLLDSLGILIDECDCERSIALWDLDNPDAVQYAKERLKKLDVFDKTKNKDEKAETDSNEFIELCPGKRFIGSELASDDTPNIAAKQEVVVYLIDSGLATEHFTSEDRRHLLNPAPQVCSDLGTIGFNYQYPPNITQDFRDENRHGTFGFHAITKGVSDSVKVVPIKVFDKEGEGTLFGMICAIYHAIDNGADIINISAGYKAEKGEGENEVLRAAIYEADSLGIIIVTAAGNEGENVDINSYYPAKFAEDYKNVISVASRKRNGKLAGNSNYGKSSITMTAPGHKICGYNHKGRKVILNGTSMAAFYVTRQLAINMSNQSNLAVNRGSVVPEFINAQSDCLPNKTKEGVCLKVEDERCNTIFEWFVDLINGLF